MSEHQVIPVLICGGTGTRLWPLSREAFPKQFLAIQGPRTLFQQTALRFADPSSFARPLVVANEEHRFIVLEQLREIGIDQSPVLVEPVGRNTAPAAAVAAMHAMELDPNAVILIAPTDHMVDDEAALRNAIRAGLSAARAGRLVLFGIDPESAAIGYGYVQRATEIMHGVFEVERFIEKPDEPTAERLLSSGSYYWNSGIVLASARYLIAELEQYAPEVIEKARDALALGDRDLGILRLAKNHFSASPSISLDHAVMERTKKAAVVPVSCGWTDLGAWSQLHDIAERDKDGNALYGEAVCEGVRNCYLRGEGPLVAAVGVDNLIVVATDDVVLITRKGGDQNVKNLVERLKTENRTAAVASRRVHRPWGFYESIEQGHRYQVKRITVNPGAKLSLQKHFHRAEHWVVVNGTALVTRDQEQLLVRENESVYLPLGAVHRLENPGKLPLDLIEVQSGAYLAEDDIVRIDDVYQRI
jgi:mannose-1-phosphate guanylyltransferase/mannose-1-phosphate guanylyltransferase/mannose-6-phosphate isomerase